MKKLTPTQLDVLRKMAAGQTLIQAHYGDANSRNGPARIDEIRGGLTGSTTLQPRTLIRLFADGLIADSKNIAPRKYSRFYVITPAGRDAVEGAKGK